MYMTDEQILKDYQRAIDKRDGIRILAGINKVSVTQMRDYLERLGVKELPATRVTGRARGKADYALFLELYQKDYSDAMIAKETGYHKTTVNKWRIRNHLPSKVQRIDAEKALELYWRGYNDREIGQMLHCSTNSVFNLRHKYGLTKNCKPGRRKKDGSV